MMRRPIPDPAGRTAILEAAKQLFARQGLKGTTLQQIGSAAQVHPSLVYHYFRDKESLYEAVLTSLMERFAGGIAAQATDAPTVSVALSGVLRMQAAIFLAEPDLPRLLVRELADHEARHATPAIRDQAQMMLKALTTLITRGQSTGEIRSDVEPRFAAISCLAQLNWFCVAGPALEQVLGEPGVARDPITVHRFAEHAAEFSMRGLRREA